MAQLRNEPGPHVTLGETMWREPVMVPLMELIKGCALTTGGMGSGKTMFALLVLAAMIRLMPRLANASFGLIDPKGELFDRCLYLLAVRLAQLQGAEREALRQKIVIIDFASRKVVTPYNILKPGSDLEFFVTNRLETLRELLPSSEKLSLRGAVVLKNVLMLLAEFGLPLTYLEAVLSDDVVRHRLISRTRNAAVRYYFEHHFAHEGKQTIGALRARMESLFDSEGVKLALDGSTAPDFCALQNQAKVILVNCGGPKITRGVRLLLQSLVASDIRQAVFARPNEPPVTYFWCVDEAQNLFLTRQQQNDIYDLLTMGRSFGCFFYFLCQNLSASADGRLLQQLYTNMRWSLTLRGTPQDGSFLRSVLPVTGRRMRPDPHPFHERTSYSLEEERSLLLDSIAHLPDRIGFYWPKTRSSEAIKLRTAGLTFPAGEAFREAVRALREESTFGGRVLREDYERQIRERNGQWLGSSPVNDSSDDAPTVQDRWEHVYRSQETLWRR